MTYVFSQLRVIVIMLNWTAKGPWNAPWTMATPLEPAGGGGGGLHPHAPKKFLLPPCTLLRSLRRSAKSLRSRRAFRPWLAHFLWRLASRFLRLYPTTFFGNVGIQSARHYFLLDFVPAHFQRFRERRSGLFGFLAALGDRFIWPADLAQ